MNRQDPCSLLVKRRKMKEPKTPKGQTVSTVSGDACLGLEQFGLACLGRVTRFVFSQGLDCWRCVKRALGGVGERLLKMMLAMLGMLLGGDAGW